jgi:arylsulfatase A-like enzyme
VWEAAYNPRNEAMLAQNLTGDALLQWKYQRYIRDYMRVIHSIDMQVGRLLNYLEANGLMENTMVVYTSDQGFYMGEHGWFDKRFMYEESFRTPLLVYAPGMKGGEKSDALVQNIDIADAEKPNQMVGTSLLPIMMNKGKAPKDWRKYLYYHYYDCPAEHNVMRHDGVSDGRYKLLHFYNPKESYSYDELYDLKKDPNELNNVIGDAKYSQHLDRLKQQLNAFRQEQKVDEW